MLLVEGFTREICVWLCVCIEYLSHTSLYDLQACLRLQEVLFRYCWGEHNKHFIAGCEKKAFGEMLFEKVQYAQVPLTYMCVCVGMCECMCVCFFFFKSYQL